MLDRLAALMTIITGLVTLASYLIWLHDRRARSDEHSDAPPPPTGTFPPDGSADSRVITRVLTASGLAFCAFLIVAIGSSVYSHLSSSIDHVRNTVEEPHGAVTIGKQPSPDNGSVPATVNDQSTETQQNKSPENAASKTLLPVPFVEDFSGTSQSGILPDMWSGPDSVRVVSDADTSWLESSASESDQVESPALSFPKEFELEVMASMLSSGALSITLFGGEGTPELTLEVTKGSGRHPWRFRLIDSDIVKQNGAGYGLAGAMPQVFTAGERWDHSHEGLYDMFHQFANSTSEKTKIRRFRLVCADGKYRVIFRDRVLIDQPLRDRTYEGMRLSFTGGLKVRVHQVSLTGLEPLSDPGESLYLDANDAIDATPLADWLYDNSVDIIDNAVRPTTDGIHRLASPRLTLPENFQLDVYADLELQARMTITLEGMRNSPDMLITTQLGGPSTGTFNRHVKSPVWMTGGGRFEEECICNRDAHFSLVRKDGVFELLVDGKSLIKRRLADHGRFGRLILELSGRPLATLNRLSIVPLQDANQPAELSPFYGRKWHGTSDKYSLDAEFVKLDQENKVWLRRKDNKIARPLIQELSESDQRFVRNGKFLTQDFSDFEEGESVDSWGKGLRVTQIDKKMWLVPRESGRQGPRKPGWGAVIQRLALPQDFYLEFDVVLSERHPPWETTISLMDDRDNRYSVRWQLDNHQFILPDGGTTTLKQRLNSLSSGIISVGQVSSGKVRITRIGDSLKIHVNGQPVLSDKYDGNARLTGFEVVVLRQSRSLGLGSGIVEECYFGVTNFVVGLP